MPMNNRKKVVVVERMLLKPQEAAEALGIGRTKLYELLKRGVLPSVKVGASLRVPVQGLKTWTEEQTNELTSQQ